MAAQVRQKERGPAEEEERGDFTRSGIRQPIALLCLLKLSLPVNICSSHVVSGTELPVPSPSQQPWDPGEGAILTLILIVGHGGIAQGYQ